MRPEREEFITLNMRPYDGTAGSNPSVYSYPLNILVPAPRDYVLWSICNFSFMNVCCLGFCALVYSFKLKLAGRSEKQECVSLNMRPYDVKIQGGTASIYTYPVSIIVQAPKDYVVWSMCNLFFMNVCCLGFCALVYSVKSRDAKIIGDREFAIKNSKKAKCYNITATICSILVLILFSTLISLVVYVYQEKLLLLLEDFWTQLETMFSEPP